MWPFRKKRETASVESLPEMLAKLKECGIELAAGISEGDVAALYSGPLTYELLLCCLGDETDDESPRPLSRQIWHLDTECIESDGDYVEVAKHFQMLASGDLPLERLQDHIEEDGAWLEFSLRGKSYRWEIELDDDWLEPSVCTRFAQLLMSCSKDRRFTYHDLKGQDCLIGCCTPDQLNRLPGLKFGWLT